jgi:hypothetical protein
MLPTRKLRWRRIDLPLPFLAMLTVLSVCRPLSSPVATSVSVISSTDSKLYFKGALEIRPDSELWPAINLDMLLFIAAYTHLSNDMHSFLGHVIIYLSEERMHIVRKMSVSCDK